MPACHQLARNSSFDFTTDTQASGEPLANASLGLGELCLAQPALYATTQIYRLHALTAT